MRARIVNETYESHFGLIQLAKDFSEKTIEELYKLYDSDIHYFQEIVGDMKFGENIEVGLEFNPKKYKGFEKLKGLKIFSRLFKDENSEGNYLQKKKDGEIYGSIGIEISHVNIMNIMQEHEDDPARIENVSKKIYSIKKIIHEFQHFHDDIRSSMKLGSPESIQKYKSNISIGGKANSTKYLHHPLETSAFFSQEINRELLSLPWPEFLQTFKNRYAVFDNLPEKTKKSFYRRLSQYWHKHHENK